MMGRNRLSAGPAEQPCNLRDLIIPNYSDISRIPFPITKIYSTTELVNEPDLNPL